MTQQSSVQEANYWEREDVGEGEEASVEDASDAVSLVWVDIDVDAQWAILSSEAVVDHVMLWKQRVVGDRHDDPHETDDDDRVSLSAQRTRVDRMNYRQVPV